MNHIAAKTQYTTIQLDMGVVQIGGNIEIFSVNVKCNKVDESEDGHRYVSVSVIRGI